MKVTSQSAAERQGLTSKHATNALGQFNTPLPLAKEIAAFSLKFLESNNSIDFLEPSIGTGNFYQALEDIARLKISNAVGVEIDQELATQTSSVLQGIEIVNSDFFDYARSASDGQFDLILANPPYSRHHHLSFEYKSKLQREVAKYTGVLPSGLSGVYLYFVIIASKLLRKNGVATWLLPSEFLDVQFGEALRTFLATKVQLLRIHSFDPRDTQFKDALTTSTIVTFRNCAPSSDELVEYTFGDYQRPERITLVPLGHLEASPKWSLDEAGAFRRADADSSELDLATLFTIRRGIATGNNRLFIVPKDEAHRLNLPSQFLKPILPPPRNVKDQVILSDENGDPLTEPKLYLVDCDVPESELSFISPSLSSYFASEEALEAKTKYLCAARKPWYKQEQRLPSPILLSYMGRGTDAKQALRFFFNESRATAHNSYLLLYPKDIVLKAMEASGYRLFDLFVELCKIDNSKTREQGRVYAGGMHKIEPSEVLKLRLPPSALEKALREYLISASPQLSLVH